LLSRESLLAISKRAYRKGVWYKALTRVERGIVDLTVKYVEKVRSPVLARIIAKIVYKVLKALRSRFLVKVEMLGYGLAERICRLAVEWGNAGASNWKYDRGFIRCLGINAISSRIYSEAIECDMFAL
jgi:hypothetical protein